MLPLLVALATPALAGDIALSLDPAAIADAKGAYALYVGDGYNGKLHVQGNETPEDGAELVLSFTQLGSLEEVTWKEEIEVDKKGRIIRVQRDRGGGSRVMTLDKKGRIVDEAVTEDLIEETERESKTWDPPDAELINPHLLVVALPAVQAAGVEKGDTWKGRLIDATVKGFPTATLQWQGPMKAGEAGGAEIAALQREIGPTQAYVIKDGAVSAIVVQSAGIQWVAAPPEQLDQLHEQETIKRQKIRALERAKEQRGQ